MRIAAPGAATSSLLLTHASSAFQWLRLLLLRLLRLLLRRLRMTLRATAGWALQRGAGDTRRQGRHRRRAGGQPGPGRSSVARRGAVGRSAGCHHRLRNAMEIDYRAAFAALAIAATAFVVSV